MTDALPAVVTGAAVTKPDGWSCEIVDVTLTCIADEPLAPPGEVTFEITADVQADEIGSIDNVARIDADTLDLDPTIDIADVSTLLTPRADLVVAKEADQETVVAGGRVAWTIEVVNDGPWLARGAVVNDAVPEGVLDPMVLAVDGAVCDQTDGVYTCPLDDLGVGDEATIAVVGTVDPDLAAGAITTTATVRSDTLDRRDRHQRDRR